MMPCLWQYLHSHGGAYHEMPVRWPILLMLEGFTYQLEAPINWKALDLKRVQRAPEDSLKPGVHSRPLGFSGSASPALGPAL